MTDSIGDIREQIVRIAIKYVNRQHWKDSVNRVRIELADDIEALLQSAVAEADRLARIDELTKAMNTPTKDGGIITLTKVGEYIEDRLAELRKKVL